MGGQEATPSTHAVLVREACKSLSDVSVLDNLNMTVPSGTVNSLLGASGSGKTTLLKCLVGALTLDSGEIQLGINSRCQLGYMPQETALYEDLRVRETFQFFGRMLGVSDIRDRVSKLSDLLHLPPSKAFIKSLSGGEKRRVSLAVALLQDPQLIILDEPTVGLDSLLRQSIWEYLYNITKAEGRTVLITTHYIEEANGSDKVSFLRGGRLLEEASPSQLLDSHNASSLDQVYLRLSIHQDLSPAAICQPKTREVVQPKFVRDSMSFNRIHAFVIKSLYSARNNPMIFNMTVVLPCVLLGVWLLTTAAPTALGIGYVNRESHCVNLSTSCQYPLSCRFLRLLRHKSHTLVELDEEDKVKAVETNRVWASLEFYPNFTEGVRNRIDYFYSLQHIDLSDWDEIKVFMDMSNYVIGEHLKRDIYDTFIEAVQDWYGDCGWNVKAVHPIIRFNPPVYGQDSYQGMQKTGGIGLVAVLQFTLAVTLGMAYMITEEELGTKARCDVAGLKYWELVVSQMLVCLVTLVPQLMFMMACLYLSFGELSGGLLLPVGLLFLQGIIGMLTGMLQSTVSSKMNTCLLVNNGFNSSFIYIVGLLWPVEGLHWLGRIVYWLVPGLAPINSFIIMLTRDYSWNNRRIIRGLLDTLFWLVALPLLIALSVHLNNRPRSHRTQPS